MAAQQGAGADGVPVPGCARHGAPRVSGRALGGRALFSLPRAIATLATALSRDDRTPSRGECAAMRCRLMAPGAR
jgi:hypothetical protein